MSGNSTFGKSVLGALAVALVTTAIPATAFAQEERREERASRPWGGGEFRRNAGQRGDIQRGEPRAEVPQAQPTPRQRPVWSSNPDASRRGNDEGVRRWRDQGRDQGRETAERRDWRERGTQRQPGWDGTRWNPTNPSQERAGVDGRNWNRERGRDGDRNWNDNRERNPAWNGRNPSYSDRDRNRDYRRDDNRNGWSNRDGWNSRNDWNGRNGWNSRNNDRRWSNNWRQDRRYDWNGFRNANRNHFRMPRYYAPFRGYNYSRLSVGIFLNSGFYGSNYWINDPWSYRLPPAYAGYRWVRYYNDVILVDTFTGEVADVIPNFFW